MANKSKLTNIDEQAMTETLQYLLEEDSIAGGFSDEGLKRKMRLEEVQRDIKDKLANGEEFTPADFIRFYGLFNLFLLERSGYISFPFIDVFEWQKFKKAFYELSSGFDEIFDFKKVKGRPFKAETNFLEFSGVFCRKHNMPSDKLRSQSKCNYLNLLADVLELRLARCTDWQKRRTKIERQRIFEEELKAAKVAIARFWKRLYEQRPPKLNNSDNEVIRELLSIRGLPLG